MTHPIYTRQSLQSLKLIELKAIAKQIGATPTDRRSIECHIAAILKRQPQLLPPSIEDCQKLTGASSLTQLHNWLLVRKISQCKDCEALYRNILNYQLGFPFESERLECGWIDKAILDRTDTAEAILDELEITFIDLSIGTDLVVPDGLDAYHAIYNGRVIVQVYNYKGGYVVRRGDGVVYDDPYSAIVNHYERYNPGAVLLARSAVDANREIKQMVFALTTEGVKAGNLALMPEYV